MTTTPVPQDAKPDMRPAVDGMLDIAARLIALMERETALLREMKTGEIAPLQAEKFQLTRAYEERARALKMRGQEGSVLDEVMRAEISETMAEFEEAAKANAIAIHAARMANERLMQAIVDVVNERKARADGYSASGQKTGPLSGPKDGVALTLNEQL